MKLIKFILGLSVLPLLFGFTNIAHRGDNRNGKYIEHTYQAYDRAAADGADYLELDVHETKDGVLVISHDNNLSRVFGVNKKITATNYVGLKKYRNYDNEPIHTLDEIFERYRSNPKLKFMIETKNETKNTGMERKMIDLIKKYQLNNRVLIESFSIPSLKQIKKIDPQLKTCLLGHKYTQVGKNDYYANGKYSKQIAKYLKKHHKKYLIWDIDTKRQMRSLIKNDMVDGVLTNYPAQLSKLKGVKNGQSVNITGKAYIVTNKARVYQIYKEKQKKTNMVLKQGQVYKIFQLKLIHEEYWYKLGNNQWVNAKNIEFYPYSKQAKSAPQLKTGNVQIVSKTTKMYHSPTGKKYNNPNLKENTKWEYFAKMNYKKHVFYNLGGNQWIDGKDVKVIK